MEFATHDIIVKSQKDWHTLYFISDIHEGAVGYNEGRLKETIKQIKNNPHAHWFGVGDYGDHIYYNDPRFSLNEADDALTIRDMRQGILGQIRKVTRQFESIKDKCLGLGTGNHEEKVMKKFHVDPTRELTYNLRVPYLGYSALTTLFLRDRVRNKRDNRQGVTHTLRVFQHHGYGGGRKHGAQINKVEDAMRIVDADIYAMAHVHGKAISELELVGSSATGKMITKQKIFIITSSYQSTIKDGQMTYAERNMYPQAPLGSPIVQFRKTWNGKSGQEGGSKRVTMRAMTRWED